MNVCLIAYSQTLATETGMKNPLGIVENCASVCYDSTPDENFCIAKACAGSGHMSVFEHISFTFHISGVSRSLLTQLTRHRHVSFSVRSQRYCNEDGFEVVTPKRCEGNSDFRSAVDEARYSYRKMISDGVPAEDARAVLPNACCTELYMTMNARALIESSHLRLCRRAQDEIRELFRRLKMAVGFVCPEVAEMMVPKCERYPEHAFCAESKSCGLHPKLEDVYRA